MSKLNLKLKNSTAALALSSLMVLGLQGCGNSETIENSAELSAVSAAAPGFISVRLDLSSLVKSPLSKEKRVIAVMSGPNFNQKKHGYFGSVDAGKSIEWPYLAANKTYNLYACIDTNLDGLCNEPSFAHKITPVLGRNNQAVTVKLPAMAKSELAKKALNLSGAKDASLSLRVTTSPLLNRKDKASPYFSGAGYATGKFEIRVQEAFFKNPDTAPVVVQKTLAAVSGAARSVVLPKAASFLASRTYQISTCGFDRFLPCTVSTTWSPVIQDVDVAIPAVNYPK